MLANLIDQDFDIFFTSPESQQSLEDDNGSLGKSDFNDFDAVSDISELSNFFEPQESPLSELANQQNSSPLMESVQSPIAKPKAKLANYIQKKTVPIPTNAAPYIAETIRVDLPRLDRLNNFSSELVTQENASFLQNQQLQSKIERIQKQFKSFDQLSKNLQTWLDKAQRSQVRTQEITLDSARLNAIPTNFSTSASLLADFDPLQMDSYGHLHSFIQEALEDIAQMDEGMRDMKVLMQQKQQTQRRKQQILKQLRYDLLW